MAFGLVLSLFSFPAASFGASQNTNIFLSHTEGSENKLFIRAPYAKDSLSDKDEADFKITADQLSSSDGDAYEKAKQAKESLGGEYENRFIAVSYETSVPEGISNESFDGAAQIGFQLALNSDEITGKYTSGEFANSFAGYYNGWDPRYWEMYYLSEDGELTSLMNPAIIDPNMMGKFYFGDHIEDYPGYFLMGMNLPATAVKGTLLIVQKKPSAPESLTDGIYHVPVDMWKTGSDEPSMGNDAVTDHLAIIEVKDGTWTVTMDWHSIEYTNLTGHILDMKYYDSEEGYENYKKDSVKYGDHLKTIENVIWQSSDLCARFVESITVPFEPGDNSLYLNVKVDAMGETRQDMRAKFIWDEMVKVEGWFYDLEDGEYDTDIRLMTNNRNDPETAWGLQAGDYQTDNAFGDTARVIIENGRLTCMYLSPNNSGTKEIIDNPDRRLSYVSAGGSAVYGEVLSAEPSTLVQDRNKITLVGFENPKTTTDLMQVQYSQSSSSGTVMNRTYYLTVAYNDIDGRSMVRIAGRDELGELLEIAGELAETTYAKQKAVYDDPVATQEELNSAVAAMEEGLSSQKKNKLDELKAAIEEAQSISADSYTETSYQALQAAIADAEAVAEDMSSTLAQIAMQIKALASASEQLVADVDWSRLDAQIEAGNGVKKSQYTTESYQYMYSALVEAREMRALPDTALPAQEQIDALADKLESRIASLVPLGSGSSGGAVEFEPASEEEFDDLQAAVDKARETLGSSAVESVIVQAAEIALEGKEISSEGVSALIAILGSLEPSASEEIDADRTALDDLLELADEIIAADDGTYESLTKLTEAVETAKLYLKSADGEPNAYTIELASSVLREAFSSLERVKPETEGVDVNDLADGSYTVPISIKNAATPSQDSMANDAVDPEALITVADEKASMKLTFKPKYLESFNQWGHLLRAWIYAGSDPKTAAGNAYNVTDMKLMELGDYYTVDEADPGTKIPMETAPEAPDDSSQYPGTVEFAMPYVSTAEGYNTIYIRVSVDAMGGDSGAQNALLKIDYSGIRMLDEDGNPVESAVNRGEIKEAIAEAESILDDASNYTDASVNRLRVALTAAYAVRYQEGSSQDKIDRAAEALRAAVEELSRDIGYVGIDEDYLVDTVNAGVFMTAASGSVPENSVLKASITTTVNYVAIANKLKNYSVTDFIPYSVSVTDPEGSSVSPNGKVTVKIKVPEGWDTDKLTVFYLKNLSTSKPLEISGGQMDADGFFVFEADSCGYFALSEMTESTGSGYQTHTVNFSAGEGGTLTARVDGVEIQSGDQVGLGETVVFTAEAETGYTVGSWSGIDGTGNPVSAVVSGDMNVSVGFVKNATGTEAEGMVTFAVSGSGGTLTAAVEGETIQSGNTVEGGKSVVFTAVPESGYEVSSWGGDASGSSNPLTKLVNGDLNVSVSFKKSSSSGGSGSSDGGSGGGSGGSTESGFFLQDGNYYVDVDLWKTAANEASMGNVAFKNNDRALVTVKNGKVTEVQIATNPVDVDQYHSAIITFKVPDSGDVEVLETGKVTTKPANNEYDYIKRVSFTMPSGGQPESEDSVTYIDVQFMVPDTPMDEAVGETLEARLKFTWSTASKTNDSSLASDDSTGSGTSSITGEDIKNIALTDAATGIKLETNTERLSDKAEMTVSRLTSGSEYDTAVEAMSGVSGTWSLYKIETSVDGKATAPEGSVTLSFPCGEEELTLYRISDSGTKTVLKGSVKDGYYVISTSSLGMFAVMGDISSEIPAEDGAFTDMQSHWAKEYVEAVVERGLFNGTSATAFSPNESMTRAMFVTVIGRLAGVDAEGSAATAFTDVKSDSYYTPYVAWAAENDIVEGTTAATFDPDRAISRQEMAVLLSRYAEFADITLKDGEAVSFADSDEISAYAKDAVEAMAKAGLLNGVGDNRFAPDDTATRAEVAALLARFIEDYSL